MINSLPQAGVHSCYEAGSDSIQAFGGGGTNNDVGIASAYATARLLRLADGPDEVHRNQIGQLELKKYR